MSTLLFTVAMAADLAVGPTQAYATIEDALDVAVDGDRILVDPGTYVEDTLDVGSRTVTVEATAPGVRVESNAQRRAFTLAGGDLTLIGFEVDGLDDVGLAEIRGGSLTLDDMTVLTTRSPVNGQPGGSIDAADASVLIENTLLDGAVAPVKDGGHVYAVRTSVTMRDSVVRAGSANHGGAAYLTDNSSLLVERVAFEVNHADTSGAALAAFLGSGIEVYESAFLTNDAAVEATVICNGAPICRFESVLFDGNIAPSVAMIDATATPQVELYGVTGCRSSATTSMLELAGSGLLMTGTVLTATDVTDATVRLDTTSSGLVVNNTFVHDDGGTAVFIADGPLTFTNNLVAFNTTTGPALVANNTFGGGYNLWFANAGGDASPATLPYDLVGVDPLIGLTKTDSCALDPLKPLYGSPMIDGGDPTLLDTDGSPSDIGAFGGDGANTGVDGLDADGDGFSSPFDCDDTNADVGPGQPEVACNGIDDDCDAATPDDSDDDGDGVSVCEGDCDDNDAGVSPYAAEQVCNGIDDDCNSATDDNVDADGDGASNCGRFDCDDGDPDRSPYLTEVSCNGIDDDCDPATLDDSGDADGDGIASCDGDCDDFDPDVRPDAVEQTCNGIDDDCDPTTVDDYDDDVDGISFCDGDCADDDPAVYPGAAEVDCNGIDDDCDPATLDGVDADGDGVNVCDDCDDTNDRGTTIVSVYFDADYDGYGVGEPTEFCVPPTNSALLDGDCDNNDDTVYPGAEEIPYDGIDQDCDGFDLDDLDGDGVGMPDDCDDNDPARYPGAADIPDDGIDQDCSGNDVQQVLVGGAGWRCGCSSTQPAGGMAGLLGLVTLVLRRRH